MTMNDESRNHQTVACCWIYASNRHAEMYLYLARENDFTAVPEALQQRFGEPRLVIQLSLAQRSSLARENLASVQRNLLARGYHLQLPPRLVPIINHGEAI